MKVLLLALILVAGEVTLVTEEEEGVIVNGLTKDIICYLHYVDGDFMKRFVPANSESKPFPIEGLEEVACF